MTIPILTFDHNGYRYIINQGLGSIDQGIIKIILENTNSEINEFYHYYRLTPTNVDSLIHKYIYANHPLEFNDPFDCDFNLISFNKMSLKEILEFGGQIRNPQKIRALYKNDKSLLYDLLKMRIYETIYCQIGIFCLTPIKDSMEMWSYYCNHRGFVLNFDISKLPKNHWGPFPINYTDKYKKIDYLKFKEWSFIYQSNIKSKCWKHEKEWRLLFYGKNPMIVPNRKIPNAQNRNFSYIQDAIKEIILGFSFFEIYEYSAKPVITDTRLIYLKKNIRLKRDILHFIIDNKIQTSIVTMKRNTSSQLVLRQIKIRILSTNKYEIKYVG